MSLADTFRLAPLENNTPPLFPPHDPLIDSHRSARKIGCIHGKRNTLGWSAEYVFHLHTLSQPAYYLKASPAWGCVRGRFGYSRICPCHR
ncbi:MAG: hypothetical protein IPL28_11365 [Chloroflexi bacterium]|nr:hypothetical protein [Chloroflexota bacterium]